VHSAGITAVEQTMRALDIPEVRALGVPDDELHPCGPLQFGQETPRTIDVTG
jgi:hypothetical protein